MVGMLKEALSHQLCEHIDLDSVLPHPPTHLLHSVSLLNEKCLQFVDHHAKEVLTGPFFLPLPKECVLAMDSLYVPEEEIFQAITRWMDHNHHNKEDIKDIIACCILDALRIQMKPELLERRSRGRLATPPYPPSTCPYTPFHVMLAPPHTYTTHPSPSPHHLLRKAQVLVATALEHGEIKQLVPVQE
ncbi:hypothetical protein EMCRGX_G000319 [Ephydatia muelleri]